MANDTKERILAAALEMFSQNGYAGTNVRELTASLGLVKSSMYKHFRSKEEIWNGSFVGFWGAMSDETMSFMPWTDGFSRGLYLAGVEVYEDTPVPDGWVKWVMPARKYLVTEVHSESYGETFETVINSLIPELGLKLAGAVCDFTEPATGQNQLFFPVARVNQTEAKEV